MTLPFPTLAGLHAEHVRLIERLEREESARLPGTTKTLPDSLIEDARQFMASASATGAQLSVAADRADAQGVLTYWASVLRGAGQEPDSTLLVRFDKNRAIQELGTRNPYKGLGAFQRDDAELFFGRRELVANMLEVLDAQHLVVVLGISGSGKSSLVRAGLLPALLDEAFPGSKTWHYIGPFVPGSDPFVSLAEAIRPAAESRDDWKRKMVADLRIQPDRLRRLLDAADSPTVLVIDQLEEAFTLSVSEDDQKAFFVSLANAVNTRRHFLAMAMRSEFNPRLSQTALGPLLQKSRLRVPSLLSSGLRDVIERPAERFGVYFDAEVVRSLIENVQNEPADLPLLQFALTKLWEARSGNRISKAAYETLGGTPQQILVSAADQIYSSFGVEDQERCRRLFLNLLKPGDGGEVTGRRRTMSELDFIGPEHVKRLVDEFQSGGLLRMSGPSATEEVVELSHESLTRNWPRLVEWVRPDLPKLRSRQLLEETVSQWEKAPATVSLYGGAQLKQALAFPDPNSNERAFLKQSRNRERLKFWSIGGILVMSWSCLGAAVWYYRDNQFNSAQKDVKEAIAGYNWKLSDYNFQQSELIKKDALATLDSLQLNAELNQAKQTGPVKPADRTTIYLQVPNESLRSLATLMVNALRKKDPTYVLPGIHVLDPQKFSFAKVTELRYFSEDNKSEATDLANVLSEYTKVNPEFIGEKILGAARIAAIPKYHFEIWIGTDAKAPSDSPKSLP